MLIWLIAAALAAQTTQAAPQPKATGKTPDKITITGCVERADQVASPAATLGTTVDSLTFVLRTPPTETVGTSGSARPATDRGYRLDGDIAKINPHVGHKVEISGYVTEPAATASGTAGSAEGPKVKVESIRMIAETCGR